MEKDGRKPLYPIGIAAELVGTDPKTLRFYEQHGLINPSRRGGKRFYSNNELQWLECLRKLTSNGGLDITSVKKLLTAAPCWSIRICPEEKRKNCPAVLDMPLPCWEIKRRCLSTEQMCSTCEVYARKMNQAVETAFWESQPEM